MNVFLDELARACGAFPGREKVLVAPSMLAGHQVLEALAIEGVAWIDLRPATPVDLAWGVAGPMFARKGIRRISGGQTTHLVERAIEDLRARGEWSYLGGLKSSLGPAPMILDTIGELRMAGVRASDLSPGSFVDPRKGEEIKGILAAYERGLSAGMLADDAAACEAALEAIRGGRDDRASREAPSGDGPVYLVPRRVEVAPLTFEFLAALSEGKRIVLAGDPAIGAPEPPGLHFDLGDQQVCGRLGFGLERQSSLSWLYRPEEAPRGLANVDVRFHGAYGRANEVRQVFRCLRSEGISADAAVAIYTSRSAYIPLFMSHAAMLDIPVTFGEGVPVNSTRPGRAVLALLRWIDEGYPAILLRRLLASGDIDVESATPLVRALREANIGWGRGRYARLWEGASDDAARRRLAEWVDDALSHIPEADERGRVSMRALCLGVERFVRRHSRVCGDLDTSAAEAFAAMLNDLPEAMLRDLLPVGEAVSRIRAETGLLYAGAARPLPGRLHVTGIRAAGWDSRPNTFIVGLDASSFPGDGLEDPVLLDVERRDISPRLGLRSSAKAAKLPEMAELLASRRGRLWLIYPYHDVAESRPCFPSPVMLQAYRLVSGNREAGYSDLERATGDPVAYRPSSPGGAVTRGEWWLDALRRNDSGINDVSELREAYPRMDAGLRAREARASNILTVYDGLTVAGHGSPCSSHALLAPHQDTRENVYSTSALEDLASCPFYYFIRRVLGVEWPREPEDNPGQWLDDVTRGRLLHDIYRRCLEEGLGRKGCGLNRDRVMEAADEVIAACRDEAPPPSELVYEFEVEGLRRSLDVFIKVQGEMAGRATPVLLEAPFGWEPGAGAAESENLGEPLEIPIPGGSRILVRGQVDRIDRIESGDGHLYAVWDYKTGSAHGYEERGYVKKGTQIQHAVYARVAEAILLEAGIDPAARVESSGYLFLTEKGEGRVVERFVGKWERASQVIQRIIEIESSGAFHATTEPGRCGWCEYSPVCGGTRAAEGARVKAELEENTLFRPWKELQEYG